MIILVNCLFRFSTKDKKHIACEPLEVRRLFASAPAVVPTVETDPVPHSNDAADDIAIWIHPTDPSQSTIIGTDKAERDPSGGGIAVYNLSGRQIQYRVEGDINNVDLRYDFILDGKATTIVAASNSDKNSVELYRVNPRTRKLENIASRRLRPGVEGVSGLAMYHNRSTGKYYVFVNDRNGVHEQWELFDAGDGKVDATRVRRFDAGHETEGLVADDELGWLYVAEEDYGIWKYRADPGLGNARTLVERVETGDWDGPLIPDVEGLTIYYGHDGEGYLIASSQGSNDYAIFRRESSNELVGKYRIGGNNELGIDRASETDGIDVVSAPMGQAFPFGAFIAQDGSNGRQNQNFKLVPWQNIAATIPSEAFASVSQNPHSDLQMGSGALRIGDSFGKRSKIEASEEEVDEPLFVPADQVKARSFSWFSTRQMAMERSAATGCKCTPQNPSPADVGQERTKTREIT